MSCTMLLKLLLGFKEKNDKKKNFRDSTITHSLFNPVLVFFSFSFLFLLIADVSLFPLVKWSHYVPGVEMYAAFSADHGSLSKLIMLK